MVKDFFLRRSFKIPDPDDSVILKIVCLCSVSPVTNKCPTVYLTEDTWNIKSDKVSGIKKRGSKKTGPWSYFSFWLYEWPSGLGRHDVTELSDMGSKHTRDNTVNNNIVVLGQHVSKVPCDTEFFNGEGMAKKIIK